MPLASVVTAIPKTGNDVAEEPCLLTILLYEKRYADFLAAVQSHDLLLQDHSTQLEAEIANYMPPSATNAIRLVRQSNGWSSTIC